MSAPLLSIAELRQAYLAAARGEFRTGSARRVSSRAGGSAATWEPGGEEQVALVVPASAGAGATTVAVAIATAAGSARVVECCGAGLSGLAVAASAELGLLGDGWMRGSRGSVLLDRRSDHLSAPTDLPAPPAALVPLTVVDAGWPVEQLIDAPGWVGDLARTLQLVVLAVHPSQPGLRRAELSIGLLGVDRTHVALVGASPRRWPRPVEQAAGPLLRQSREMGRVTCFPADRGLAISGLTPEAVPPAITAAAARLLALVKGLSCS
ncbi:MAG: hypothetical protein KIT69_06425 [Propionibacteriaceae bacterium]|nr:hypothetical protein [Propionibacteriaceae bacterium]